MYVCVLIVLNNRTVGDNKIRVMTSKEEKECKPIDVKSGQEKNRMFV